jgi:hypothetical protein
MKIISDIIVSLLVVAAAVTSTHAAKNSSFKTKGQSASVYATSCSDCGCSSLSIDASESSSRQGSTTFTTNNVNVYISTYDFCTEESSYGSGSTTFSGFPNNWVKKGGSAVTLNLGTLDVCSFDYYGGATVDCQSVSGSVTVTPTSDYTSTSTCRGTDSYNSPFFKGKTIYNSSGRTASAKATLNVSIDGVPTSFNDFEVSANVFDSKSKVIDKTVTVPY